MWAFESKRLCFIDVDHNSEGLSGFDRQVKTLQQSIAGGGGGGVTNWGSVNKANIIYVDLQMN
jgi:hypothetical protein